MPNKQPKKIPLLPAGPGTVTDIDDVVKAVNVIADVLNAHMDGMLEVARLMSSLTDMVGKHNAFLVELRKRESI